MNRPSLKHRIVLPEFHLLPTGDFRNDFINTINVMRDALQEQADQIAINRGYGVAGQDQSPTNTALAADLLTQVSDLAQQMAINRTLKRIEPTLVLAGTPQGATLTGADWNQLAENIERIQNSHRAYITPSFILNGMLGGTVENPEHRRAA